ncbi:MAG TPA: helix-turn-helix domain-containing protein [Pyrinomonadaceae bacterium]
MSGNKAWEQKDIRLLSGTGASPAVEQAASTDKIKTLRRLALNLMREVVSLNEVQFVDLRNGVDFYDEVRRFEINLIQRALEQTGGNQVRAARMLGLKVTTLNTKIKNYGIHPESMQEQYAVPDPGESDLRKHA